MTLARSSVLHYWSSRYGPLPVIGGKPTHARNSAGMVGDGRGELYDAIINTPRFSWETDKSTSANERRAMLLLERGGTNQIPFSADLSNAAWSKVTATITTGVRDPRGGTSACTVTATAASAQAYQLLAAGASIKRANALWVRRRTGTGAVSLFRSDGVGDAALTLTTDWQRFPATVPAASTARWVGIILATSGDAVDVWDGQQEDAPVISSEIVNPGAGLTSRSADSFYWDFPPIPQGMMVYLRFVERGSVLSGGYLLSLMSAANANPQFILYAPSGLYTAYHHNGTAPVSALVAVAPAVGDTVELVAQLTSAGIVNIIQSINGAAVTAGSASGANTLAGAWSDTKCWLNSAGIVGGQGLAAFADVRIVKYADVVGATGQAIMDELRAFELGPNGDLL